MKEINDLKAEKNEKINCQLSIVNKAIEENRGKSEDESKEYKGLEDDIKKIDERIQLLEAQEDLNKRSVGTVVKNVNTKETFGERFLKAVRQATDEGQTVKLRNISIQELRAEPLLSTSITVPNTPMGGVSIVKQDAKGFLQNLGVRVLEGVKGQITLRSSATINATFPGENTTDVSANFTLAELKLNPRRVSISHKETKEFLANVDDQTIIDLQGELYDAIYRRGATDLMYNFFVDALDASTKIAGATLAYSDYCNLMAGVGAAPKSPAFVTSPKVGGYSKSLVKISGVAGPVWDGNPYIGSIDGIPSYGTPYTGTTAVNGTPSLTSKQLFYGDWNESAVAQYGTVDITINPFSFAKEGAIEFVVDTLMDTGIINYRAFQWIQDVSIV